MKKDVVFMRQALCMAEKGRGYTQTNPVVGAVIVKNGVCIAKGYHAYWGGPHAEIMALAKAGNKATGATMYVTLEPCSTYGKTPPCTDAIIRSGIVRVVIALSDPNPVNGKRGIRILRTAGIQVTCGVCEDEARIQNEAFITMIRAKRPYVIVKMAQSLDGKIATRTGDSAWISSEESRTFVHTMRTQVDAIMVGSGTALHDNPRLRVTRVTAKRQPARIILDTWGKVPLSARVFSHAEKERVYVVVSKTVSKARLMKYRSRGITPLPVPLKKGKLDCRSAMHALYALHVGTIMVEGGGELVATLLNERLVDKLYIFIAPLIIGGRCAKTSVEGEGVARIAQALSLKNISYHQRGKDIVIEAQPCLPDLSKK